MIRKLFLLYNLVLLLLRHLSLCLVLDGTRGQIITVMSQNLGYVDPRDSNGFLTAFPIKYQLSNSSGAKFIIY
jgi:hypothetical protein